MKKIIFICLTTLILATFGFGQSAKVKTKDFQPLTGAQWTGNLIYLDYGTKKQISIPSNLTITQSKEDKNLWIFEYQYPDEPKANSRDEVKISENGRMFEGGKIVEKIKLPDKTLKIITEKTGTDNDKDSSFRFTYLIGKNKFSIKKEVKYNDAKDFFVRNEYSWKR